MKPIRMLGALLLLSSCSWLVKQQLEPICGDGFNDAEDCTASCGNGAKDDGEACEGLELGGQSCQTLDVSFVEGTLQCSSSCTFDTSQCLSALGGSVTTIDVDPDAHALAAGAFFPGERIGLALASPTRLGIEFYHNNNDGTFSQPELEALGLEPTQLVVAKLDASSFIEGILFVGEDEFIVGFQEHDADATIDLLSLDTPPSNLAAGSFDLGSSLALAFTTNSANNGTDLTITLDPQQTTTTKISSPLRVTPRSIFFDKLQTSAAVVLGVSDNDQTQLEYFNSALLSLDTEDIDLEKVEFGLLFDIDDDNLKDLIAVSQEEVAIFSRRSFCDFGDCFEDEAFFSFTDKIVDAAVILLDGAPGLVLVTEDEIRVVDLVKDSATIINTEDTTNAEVVVADFNADQREDVAVLLPNESKLKIFFSSAP